VNPARTLWCWAAAGVVLGLLVGLLYTLSGAAEEYPPLIRGRILLRARSTLLDNAAKRAKNVPRPDCALFAGIRPASKTWLLRNRSENVGCP